MDRWTGSVGGAGRGGGSGNGGHVEPVQLLGLAEKLLDARDLVGSRKFAERAIVSEPLLDGADRVLVAADVLLAAQRRRINNHVDWYAVLQLDANPSSGCRDLSEVRLQYRRLALLLHPGGHQPSSSSSAVDAAFKLISEAWAVLSDPAKKELYDKELAIAAAAQLIPNGGGSGGGGRHDGEDGGVRVPGEAKAEADGDGNGSFWTACTNCVYVHQYERGYEGRALLCPNCRKAFSAKELASPPPIVPGSDMYYCAWGLFPLGFPGGPDFGWPANAANGPEVWRDPAGKPWSQAFFPGFPSWWGAQGSAATGGWVNADHGNGGSHVGFGSAGERQKQGDEGVSGNQSFSAANKAWPDGATMSEKAASKEMRKKVMAKRPKKQVAAGAVGCGVTASGEAEMAVNSANKGGADTGQPFAAKRDGGNNAQNVGCSRTVEISAEDLDLNSTDNILSSMSSLPFLKDGEIVVVD